MIDMQLFDQQIHVASCRGFYDAKELRELDELLHLNEIDPDVTKDFIDYTENRLYSDGLKVVDWLLDLRNIASPPKIIEPTEVVVAEEVEVD